MEPNLCSACVELKIPCKPEYVGIARLAILGVASRMKFSYDEVEDVRLAVGEACTSSVERSEKNGRNDNSFIMLRSQIGPEKLIIDIIDEAGSKEELEEKSNEQDPDGLGALLITLLVDEVIVSPVKNGTQVRMVKYAREQ